LDERFSALLLEKERFRVDRFSEEYLLRHPN
jgi:hypothetical protein